MAKKIKDFVFKYMSILELIVCLILGFAFTASKSYLNIGSCKFSFILIVKSIVLAIIFYLIAILVRCVMENITKKSFNSKAIEKKLESLFLDKYSIFTIAFIILIFWIPILIAMFPGTLINDTWGQLSQYYYQSFSDHHPFFDTLIIGSVILGISKATYTPHWHSGFFVFVLIQAFITALVFSYTIIYSKKKLKLNNKILLIILLVYCFLPIFPMAVQTISKDAIFSWIYVLFMINFMEIVRSNGKNLNIFGLIYTLIISILCVLTKKVGGYVVIFSYIALLLVQLKNWKELSFIIIFLGIFTFVLEPNILRILGVSLGGKQEKYSMLFQQTARCVKEHPDDVTDDEKKAIDNVLDYYYLAEDYDPVIADRVKGYSQKGKDEDYPKYLKVWFKQGLRHPGSYIQATNAMLSGSFSFSEYIPKTDMKNHDQLPLSFMSEDVTVRSKPFQKLTDGIVKIYNILYSIPIIGKILSYGFWVSLVPAFLAITLLKYRKNINKEKYFIVIVPLLLSIFLGVWLAPVTAEPGLEGMRYVYPIIYTVPLTIMWCFYCLKNNLENKV